MRLLVVVPEEEEEGAREKEGRLLIFYILKNIFSSTFGITNSV